MGDCTWYMRLRSGKLIGAMAEDKVTVQHAVTNYKSGIEPFAGRVNGELKQSVEVFIESIETHLAAKEIKDPHSQFVEAKSHFNLSQGDLGEHTRSIFFRDCKTWEDLKQFLRSTYGSGDQKDVVLDLRRVLKLHDREGRSFVANNARINDSILDFISNLKDSSWADAAGKKAISLINLGRLLQLAIGLQSLPDALVNSFDEEFSPTSTEKDVMGQIKKNISKMPVGDSTILSDRSKGSVVAKVQVTPRTDKVNRQQQQQHQPVSSASSSQVKALRCFNCGVSGHAKSNCMSKYCAYHQSTTHGWRECKVSGPGAQQYRQPRNRSRSGERWYRGRSQTRSQNGRGNQGNFGGYNTVSNFQRRQSKGGAG